MFKELEPEDLLKFGLIPEFVAVFRFSRHWKIWTKMRWSKILSEPKNALIKQYQRLFEMEDTQLSFQEDALKAIAKKAIKRKTGARGLRSIIESILLETMFELPGLEGVEEVVISEEVINGNTRPLYIYGDKKAEEETAESA